MPKLTDDEVGTLLRETFVDKENLVDQLPTATTSPARRKAPALLAAAAVVAVLAGTVTVAGRDHQETARPTSTPQVAEKAEPASSTGPMTGSTTAELNLTAHGWALALKEVTKAERPPGGWPVVKVLDAWYEAAGNPSGPGAARRPFDERERAWIASYSGVRIEWVKSRPTGSDICDQPAGTPYVTLGKVVFDRKVSTGTVGVSLWRGCLDARWLTYRLVDDPSIRGEIGWRITGTVGPVAVS
jgi:hypothetical protein